MPTIRINDYTLPKLQAIKELRILAQSLRYTPRSFGLKEAKDLLDRVDEGEQPTFEVDMYPGAALGRLRHYGLDMEVIPEVTRKKKLLVYLKEKPGIAFNPQEFLVESGNPDSWQITEGVLIVRTNDDTTMIPLSNIILTRLVDHEIA